MNKKQKRHKKINKQKITAATKEIHLLLLLPQNHFSIIYN